MNQNDQELVAELHELSESLASLALRITDGSTGAAVQKHQICQLMTMGVRLQRRAKRLGTIDGEVVAEQLLALPAHTTEPVIWRGVPPTVERHPPGPWGYGNHR